MVVSQSPSLSQKIPWWLLLGFVFLFPFGGLYIIPIARANYDPTFHLSSFIRVFSALIALSYIVKALANKTISYRFNGLLTLPAIAIACWGSISLIWAGNRYEALVPLLDWIATLIVFLAIVHEARQPDRARRITITLYLGGAIFIAITFLQRYGGFTLIPQATPIASTLGNVSIATQYALFTFPIGVILAVRSNNPLERILAIVGTIGHVIYLFSGSNLAVQPVIAFITIGLFLWLAIWFIVVKLKNRKLLTPFAIVLLIITPFILLGSRNFITGYWNRILENNRINITGNSMSLLADHAVVGVGVGNWKQWYPYYQSALREDTETRAGFFHEYAHNDIIQIISELGLIGLAICIWFSVNLIRGIIAIIRRSLNRETLYTLAPASAIAVVAIALDMLVNFPLQKPSTLTISVIHIALLGASAPLVAFKKPLYIAIPVKRSLAAIVCGASIAATIIYTALVIQWNISQHLFVQSRRMVRQDDVSGQAIISVLDQSDAYWKGRPDLDLIRAIALSRIPDIDAGLVALQAYSRNYPYEISALRIASNLHFALSRCNTADQFDPMHGNIAFDAYQKLRYARPYDRDIIRRLTAIQHCIEKQ